ncbi:N-acetylglucosamine-6-phosphate deacetylase [Marinicrinis lubricantis]|uniref:N-acetylglucosamine-6-phosphate deacetylase n=1 Tax=Marinicrinis lubricantis TaxID=2086470 RepID=A0ABW1IRJ2_9BACL
MKICIQGGNVVTETGVLNNQQVLLEEGKITAIGPPDTYFDQVVDASGCYVLPGFIDLHVHGGGGADVSDGTKEAIQQVCRFHAAHGTTGMLLTTRTMPKDEVSDVLRTMASCIHSPDPQGSLPMGIHLEGPFIHEDYKGAQNADHMIAPDVSLMEHWMELSEQSIRLVTLAPEKTGADQLIRWLTSRGIIASAGHCGPDYDTMLKAIEYGVSHITHCFNGMSGFSHRNPGMLAAALMDERVSAELIMDTIHVHPAAGKLLLYNKGLQNTLLVTDAIRAAGLPDGEYRSAGGRQIYVEDGAARLPSGQLAGSTLTMNKAVAHAVQHMGVSVQEASIMASLIPARKLGLSDRKGSIMVGKDADVVIADSDFNVRMTIRNGRVIYRSIA